MPSLKAIRLRIASVKSTQKITKAMKHVAAAKLKRAQDAAIAARPYARRLQQVVAEVATQGAGTDKDSPFEHPLLRVREPKRVMLLALTSDRGLCGGFNANVQRAAERFLEDNRGKFDAIQLAVLGKKGREYFRRRRASMIKHTYAGAVGAEVPQRAAEIAAQVIADYQNDALDAVYVVYNEFKSAISQRTAVERLLPIEPDAALVQGTYLAFEFEPSRRALLDKLLPMYVEIELNRVILESVASFFGAQMSAMDSATNNASDMISAYTLQFNRARQAAITKELMEIIGGAEALKG